MPKDTAITSDIMELISEEELSVCRSEGSPPRKVKKRKIKEGKENAAAEGTTAENVTSSTAVNNNTKKANGGKGTVGLTSGTSGKKVGSQKSATGNMNNFRIRPERSKRTTSVGQQEGASESETVGGAQSDSAVSRKVVTMNGLLN